MAVVTKGIDVWDDEQLGFLAGDEYRRAAASRDADAETDRPERTGPPEPGVPGPRAAGLPADLAGGRFEDADPPGCPAPRHPTD